MLKLMRLLLALIFLTLPVVLDAAESYPPQRPELYGCPWAADSLGNLEIGKAAGRKVAYRFLAGHTGTTGASARWKTASRRSAGGCT